MEARLRRYDGGFRWFLMRVEPLRDETGKIIRWYGTCTDIETLKQTEEKLREDERELRRITDAIPQTIVVLDPSGALLYANQATLDYTGLTTEDVTAPGFRERIFHPEDVEKNREFRKAALERGLPFEAEHRALREDGQYRWFLTRYNPFRNDEGQVTRWYATGTDIDDRVRAEERTRNENLALREQIDRDSMFEDIVGSSEALKKVLRQIAKLASSDSRRNRYWEGVDRSQHPQAIQSCGSGIHRCELRCHPTIADCFRAFRSREGRFHRRNPASPWTF
jgi:formate hydrogenlyase transcriptional activator